MNSNLLCFALLMERLNEINGNLEMMDSRLYTLEQYAEQSVKDKQLMTTTNEEPVFPVCGTCNAQKEQELSDNELQGPKAGAMEMLLEATNPNCKDKPDSSLLLSQFITVIR